MASYGRNHAMFGLGESDLKASSSFSLFMCFPAVWLHVRGWDTVVNRIVVILDITEETRKPT